MDIFKDFRLVENWESDKS